MLSMRADANCKEEFNKLLKYSPIGGEKLENERAFIYYVSMAKHLYDLGNYDFCIKNGQEHNLKYVLFALKVSDFKNNDRFIYGGGWIPALCSEQEIQEAYQATIEQQYRDTYETSHGLKVSFPEENEPSYGVGSIISIVIHGIALLLVIIGTVVDRTSLWTKTTTVPNPNYEEDGEERHALSIQQTKTKVGCFLSSFSVPRNFQRIFTDRFTMQKEMKIFNGLFVISLIFIILNNSYFVSIMYGIVGGSKLKDYEKPFPQFIFLKLRFVYEVFYFWIGFTSWIKIWTNFYSNDQKGNVSFEILRLGYRRFIPQAFLLVWTIFLFQHWGNGPLYQFWYDNWIIGSSDVPICKEKWWTPLLFLSSVYKPRVDRQCLSWLWIISNEMIFFVALVWIFYAYRKRALYGYLLIFFLLFASMITSLIESILLDFTYSVVKSMVTDSILFIHPINSCQGYLWGVLFALIWFSYKNQGDEIHRLDFVVNAFKRLLKSGFLRITIIVLCLAFAAFPVSIMDESSSKVIITSIFVAIERTVISIALGVFLLPWLAGKWRILRIILGNRLFTPLARLNTSALLVHGVILMWYFFGKFQILNIAPIIMNFSFIALTLLSYVTAVGFTLLFESPYITMENLLLCPKRKRNYSNGENSQENFGFDTDKVPSAKRTGSFEVKSEKLEKEENKYNSKDTMISNTDDKMRSDINYSIEASNIANSMVADKPKKRNSVTNSQENSKKPLRGSNLLNESEDSNHADSFHEPLIG